MAGHGFDEGTHNAAVAKVAGRIPKATAGAMHGGGVLGAPSGATPAQEANNPALANATK